MYQITLEIRKLDEGPYLGTSPDLPGLIVQGASPEEVPLPPGLHPLESPARIQIVVPA